MARQQDGQPDEVTLAKQRLSDAGQEIQTFVRQKTKYAAIVGVAATFGAGLLLSSGRLNFRDITRAATSLPKLLAYVKLGREALSTINQVIASQRRQPASGETPPPT